MKKVFSVKSKTSLLLRRVTWGVIGFALALPGFAQADTPKRLLALNNYIEFFVQGDCGQEDCIAAVYYVFNDIPGIVTTDATALAQHQAQTTNDYKVVIVSFKDMKGGPYTKVMQGLSRLGYHVVSYVIHDTHDHRTDTIVQH